VPEKGLLETQVSLLERTSTVERKVVTLSKSASDTKERVTDLEEAKIKHDKRIEDLEVFEFKDKDDMVKVMARVFVNEEDIKLLKAFEVKDK
jgi:hypothetical protein